MQRNLINSIVNLKSDYIVSFNKNIVLYVRHFLDPEYEI